MNVTCENIRAGDDSLTLPLMSIGAKGVVSVVANLAPKQVCLQLLRTFQKYNFANAWKGPVFDRLRTGSSLEGFVFACENWES